MGSDVLEGHPLGPAGSLDRSDLVEGARIGFFGRAGKGTSAESDQIGVSRVRPHGDGGFFGRFHGLQKNDGVAGVEATCYVGRRDAAQNGLIIAESVGAEAFSQITIQVDAIQVMIPLSQSISSQVTL